MDSPSPKISSVTPWRISLCDRPSANRPHSLDIMLMNPGAITSPRTSRSIFPRAPETSPTFAIVSPLIATPPAMHGDPLPSQIRPLRRTTSYCTGCAQEASRQAATIVSDRISRDFASKTHDTAESRRRRSACPQCFCRLLFHCGKRDRLAWCNLRRKLLLPLPGMWSPS